MDNLVEIQVTFIGEKWERVNRAWGWHHRVLCLGFDLVTYGFRAPSRTFQGLHPQGASVSHHTWRITILTAWVSRKD